jgi:hypothetical protein
MPELPPYFLFFSARRTLDLRNIRDGNNFCGLSALSPENASRKIRISNLRTIQTAIVGSIEGNIQEIGVMAREKGKAHVPS